MTDRQSKSYLCYKTIPCPGLRGSDGDETATLGFKLYLPAGYDNNVSERYPVVYLLHGANSDFKVTGCDPFFPALDELIDQGRIPGIIAVAPIAGNSYWVDSMKYGTYEAAIIRTLIPHIDTYYRTLPSRDARYIAGYSMGGFGALRYSLVYPELFEACILLSPFIQNVEPPATSRAATGGVFTNADGVFSLDVWQSRNYPQALTAYARQEKRVRFFIYAGDKDWNHLRMKEDLPDDAWKYNMEVQAVLLYAALGRKNLFDEYYIKGEDVPVNPAELRIVGGGHEMRIWVEGFSDGLQYIFSCFRL